MTSRKLVRAPTPSASRVASMYIDESDQAVAKLKSDLQSANMVLDAAH